MTQRKICIIGDRFMLTQAFADAILESCKDFKLELVLHEMPWPDEPMEHGYAVEGMEGLKEYMGSADEVVGQAEGAEVLVTQLAPLSASMMARLPQLRCVVVSRGGPVNIDIQAARARGIRVANVPGRNASAVAEFTIGAILAETRNITRGHDALRKGQYRGDLYRADMAGRELHEMTVGIVGYGEVGRLVVKLLKVFGCRIMVADPYVQLTADDLRDGVEHVSFDALLAAADVVSLHLRVMPETKGIMDEKALRAMKPDATLVNTARGPLLDYDALYRVMSAGHLRGAMLETFAIEPVPPDWPLLQLPNVTLTPHIAGASRHTIMRGSRKAAEEVRRYLAGEPPLNPC